jgi:hypothetical protein
MVSTSVALSQNRHAQKIWAAELVSAMAVPTLTWEGVGTMNAALGLWLFFSAFLWPHGPSQRLNALIVGMLAVTAALVRYKGVRWAGNFNALLGGWLIISALLLPRVGMVTFWNHVIVGFLFALFGLAPSLRGIRRHTPVRH